ncbi:MAG: tyrosine-type recombinase/integrase [Puniceicoccales bacterium]
MAKPIKCPVRRAPSGAWCYDLPPALSDTGKRQRKFFERKKQAELARDADLERHRLYGVEGHSLPASQMADAAKAFKLLGDHDVSLSTIAREWVAQRDAEGRSRNFRAIWIERMDSLIGSSEKYLSGLNRIGNRILPDIGSELVCNINHERLRETLAKHYKSPHVFNNALRSVSPFFEWAVKEQWTAENPCKRIEFRKTGRTKIEILDLNQCRKLMISCRDYREDDSMPANLKVDCRDALAAVAIALFSGVRPGGELERLEWKDIDLAEGTLFVSNQKAKTDRSRFFEIPDTLKAWLDTIPRTKRHGDVCPANWKRTWQAIRKAAGIGELRDATRKTFATMHLAHFGDVNKTRAIMGHEVGDVLFQNYRGLATPKQAAEFWAIIPSEKATAPMEVVA